MSTCCLVTKLCLFSAKVCKKSHFRLTFATVKRVNGYSTEINFYSFSACSFASHLQLLKMDDPRGDVLIKARLAWSRQEQQGGAGKAKSLKKLPTTTESKSLQPTAARGKSSLQPTSAGRDKRNQAEASVVEKLVGESYGMQGDRLWLLVRIRKIPVQEVSRLRT